MTARLRSALLYAWFVALAAVLSAAFAQTASSAPRVPSPPPTTLPTNMPLHSPPRLVGSSALSLDESTIEEMSFEPLTPSDRLCPGGQYNWYGKCVNVFRLFGHTSPKDYSVNLLTLSKVSHAVGVAIDKSVTPNRVYVADSGNNRILGWRSLGQCSVSHSACTFTSDCGGSGGTCNVDPLKPADLVIGTPARCNGDSNIGNLGSASADSLCLMDFPQNSNMPESSFPVPLTVNSSGDLLVTDLWNNRVLRFNDPFGTDTTADFVWGQSDFSGTKVNQGRGVGSPSDSSFSFHAPGRDAWGSPGASQDASGNTWIADNQNGRVLRFPPGSHSADLVLGQGDFFSTSDQNCLTNSADFTVTPPLNILCGPVMARVHPVTGELWVLDNGYLGPYTARISVFTPPFSNGMFASREIKPNIASLTDPWDGTVHSPYYAKGWTFQWNEDLTDYPTGVLWLNEAWQGSGETGRILLLGASGDVLATIGSTGANISANWLPGGCGEIMQDYYSWRPFFIAVSGRNLLIANDVSSTVARYELPAVNWMSGSTLCPPRAVGGLLDNSTFWSTPSPETMKGPIRVVAHAGQLAVSEESTLKVWNDYLTRPFGAPPDFEIPSLGNSFAQFATDDNGYLWNGPNFGSNVIQAYRWPLTLFSTPAWSGVPHWADDGTPVANFGTGSAHHVSFDPVHHWLWITDHNRILRVSNYAAALASGGDLLVDMVIGQTSKNGTFCNQGSPDTPGPPSAYTLCSGGKTAVDPGGNLFVVDVADAGFDLAAGNNRILGYRAADLAGASGLFPNIPAAVVFSDHTRFDEVSSFGFGPPAVIAFDGLGRMYLPNHCGFRTETQTQDGHCYWEMVVFGSPFTKQTPDSYLRLPSGWSPGIGFDESSNLVWADTSASHVTVINPVTDPVWLTPMASYRFRIDHGWNPFSLQAGGPSYDMWLGIIPDAGSVVPVEFTLGPLPAGVTAHWSPTSSCPDGPCATDLVLTASSSAAPGMYSLPIMATSTEGLRRYVVGRFRIDGPLTCSGPAVASVGQTIAFFAHGGTGPTELYAWGSDGTPASTEGATYDVSFATEGTHTATISLLNQTVNCSVVVGSAPVVYTLTITKSGSGTGTVSSTPSGIDCGSDCSQSYSAGTAVTLSALPDAGFVFAGWSGDPNCSDGVVTMNANKTCTATFGAAPDLIVSALTVPATGGAGLAISVNSTTKNQGSAAASASTTKFYLSTDAAWDASDTYLGSRTIAALAAGGISAGSVTLTIPAGTTSGNYFVIAKADADNLLFETNEANNTASAPIVIAPDLIVSALTAPASAVAGSTISVTDTTKNNTGTSTAPASTTKFYLSTNTTWEATDTFIGSRSVPSLTAGSSNSGPANVAIPAATATGNYYIIAKADGDNALFEQNEANNTKSAAIRVSPPDLVVSALSVPTTGGAGLNIIATNTTKNQTGTGPAPASVTKFYLSANATWDSGDLPFTASQPVGALAPGASEPHTTTLTIPASFTGVGTFYVIAKADADGLIPETLETNNTAYDTIVIGPDLIVSALTVPATGGAGLPITVTDTTKNQGAGSAATSTTKFYLSTNNTYGTGDVWLGDRAISSLGPGATNAGSTTLTIPAGTAVGSYYILALADGSNVIPETVETNNTAAALIKLSPDLTVSVLGAPTSAAVGAHITVTDTTKNSGLGSAVATTTSFYLSTNTTYEAGDIALGSRAVPILASGATSPGSTSVTIPATTAQGAYYILARADSGGAVAEGSETNNVTYKAITITQ